MPGDAMGVLLISGGHERAHYAFMLAVAGVAMGRDVVVFATNEGCRGLTAAAAADPREAVVVSTGVAGLDELRAVAINSGVRLMACNSGLRMAGLEPSVLLAGVDVTGLPAFLSAVGRGQIVTV